MSTTPVYTPPASTPPFVTPSTTYPSTTTPTTSGSTGSPGYSPISGYSTPDVNATGTDGKKLSTVDIFFTMPFLSKIFAKFWAKQKEDRQEQMKDG